MPLDLSSLERAAASLGRALARASAAPGDEELRDACIQRFEHTFELCWKTLKRRLELDLPTPSEVDGYSFKQLLRAGGERGLVADVAAWFDYREKRSLTPHTYDDRRAEEVYAVLPRFHDDALALLARLKAANAD
jgi:nucleotidyltransferase substrate binding protein (TIGR01987 family)